MAHKNGAGSTKNGRDSNAKQVQGRLASVALMQTH